MSHVRQPIIENRVIQFESMTRISFVQHFFTTKSHGLGREGFSYLRRSGSITERAIDDMGLTPYKMAFSRQGHTDHIAILKTLDDVDRLNASKDFVDGLLTQLKDVALFTVYADCTPVYVVDRVNRTIGLVHSGWRGTIQGIAPKLIRLMVEQYATCLENLTIVIGPSISQAHFEVGEEVKVQFEEVFGDVEGMIDEQHPKPHVDVRKAIVSSLIRMGIQEEQIECSTACTYNEDTVFYSYRREGNEAGRMAAVLVRVE